MKPRVDGTEAASGTTLQKASDEEQGQVGGEAGHEDRCRPEERTEEHDDFAPVTVRKDPKTSRPVSSVT